VWRTLSDHQQAIANQHMRDWFAKDSERFTRFSLQAGDIFLDYSRNRVTDETMQLLVELARQVQLQDRIAALFNGQPVNTTENQPALHTALRDPQPNSVSDIIAKERVRLDEFVNAVRSGKFRHIVNIGIGGSYMGPLMATHALKEFATANLNFYFISCVDKTHLDEVLSQIDPATTLFIISSKSFATFETLLNAKTVMQWMQEKVGKAAMAQHFVAVTAKKEKARALGIADERIFPVWEWVGGRYSIWSAIGLPLMLMLGMQGFNEFLAGAHAMDTHFQRADIHKNMPVLLALIGIWHTNFFAAHSHVIAPYSQRLRYLIPYLQQAGMESNGKMVNHQHEKVTCQTSPVIFGEAGCNAQHTYHQLLHQGTHLIPIDFILVKNAKSTPQDDVLFASGVSQAHALMHGQTHDEPHRVLPGNRPSNILLLDQLTPRSLGALLALYEHKIFVQGVIWNVNSFDQWGVELGKQLLPQILSQLENEQCDDPALAGLIKQYRNA
jgi:glucose-6-phosphate isomerase